MLLLTHSSQSLEVMLTLMMERTGQWTNIRWGHHDISECILHFIFVMPGSESASVSCPWAWPQPGASPLKQVRGNDVSIPQGDTLGEIIKLNFMTQHFRAGHQICLLIVMTSGLSKNFMGIRFSERRAVDRAPTRDPRPGKQRQGNPEIIITTSY